MFKLKVLSVNETQIWKFSDARIQDISTSISIKVKFEEMTGDEDDDDDESDKHLEARDRRYSCLIWDINQKTTPKRIFLAALETFFRKVNV